MKISEFFLSDLENPDYKKLFRDWRFLELAQTDWTQLIDASVNSENWAQYRQALRDLPAKKNFADVELPTRPI